MNGETDAYDSRSSASYHDGEDPSIAKIYCLLMDRATSRARVIGHHYACPEATFWDVVKLLFFFDGGAADGEEVETNYMRM